MKKFLFQLTSFVFICFTANAQWTQKANTLGNPRYNFAGFSLNGNGFIGGGRFGGPFNAIETWQQYNPNTNAWSYAAVMPYKFTGLSAFEVGINAEYYSKKMPILINNPEKQFFFNGYIAIEFGRRK